MKKIYLCFALLVVFAACSPNEKQEVPTVVGKYGAEIAEDGAVSVDEMLAQLNVSDTVQVKVKGEITATCAMKGCWMNLVLPNGEEMRVTFKDYEFFVPKEGMEGNMALIEGQLTRTLTDMETLRHYAEDAGKSEEEVMAITEDKQELSFVANGVIIYKTQEEAVSE